MPMLAAVHEARIAVCVAGAVRSLVERPVYETMWKFFPSTDVYAHLFTSVELSARGQRNLSTDAAHDLQRALAAAKAVRFQTTENPTTCDQMTTGKFYKIQKCAELVEAAVANEKLDYDVIVVTRPDLAYTSGKTVRSFVPQKTGHWFKQVGDEMFVASFARGLALSATLTQARCCDVGRRLPPQCFVGKSKMPRSNFIQRRHFDSLLKLPDAPRPYRIVRTADQRLEMRGRDPFTLHGMTKHDVRTSLDPTLSPPLLNWSLMPATEQYNWLREYLPPPRIASASQSRAEPRQPPPRSASAPRSRVEPGQPPPPQNVSAPQPPATPMASLPRNVSARQPAAAPRKKTPPSSRPRMPPPPKSKRKTVGRPSSTRYKKRGHY